MNVSKYSKIYWIAWILKKKKRILHANSRTYSPIFWISPPLPVYNVKQPFHIDAYLQTQKPSLIQNVVLTLNFCARSHTGNFKLILGLWAPKRIFFLLMWEIPIPAYYCCDCDVSCLPFIWYMLVYLMQRKIEDKKHFQSINQSINIPENV